MRELVLTWSIPEAATVLTKCVQYSNADAGLRTVGVRDLQDFQWDGIWIHLRILFITWQGIKEMSIVIPPYDVIVGLSWQCPQIYQ